MLNTEPKHGQAAQLQTKKSCSAVKSEEQIFLYERFVDWTEELGFAATKNLE